MLAFETERITLRQASITTGIAMLIMVVCAGIAVGFVHAQLITEDAATTVSNIQQSIPLLSLGIFCWLLIIICDVILSWSFYVFFKQVHASLSLLSMLFRLIYTTFLGIATFQLLNVLNLLSAQDSLSLQSDALTMIFIESFQSIWSFGLIIFGFHLWLIGCLVLKAAFIPKVFGYLLLLASSSYIIVHTLDVFFLQASGIAQTLETSLSIPMAIGELGIGLWMLFKGGKAKS